MNLLTVMPRSGYFRKPFYPRLNRAAVRIAAAVCAIAFCAGAGARADAGYFFAGAADNGRFLWKSVGRAQLKLEDKTPLQWNVYQTDKKKEANLVLVQLGRRFMALDIKGKVAYYVFPSDLQAKGPDFESGNSICAVAGDADDCMERAGRGAGGNGQADAGRLRTGD